MEPKCEECKWSEYCVECQALGCNCNIPTYHRADINREPDGPCGPHGLLWEKKEEGK